MNKINKETKYCKHCGKKISKEAVICVHCGLQVEELKYNEIIKVMRGPQVSFGRCDVKNKWVALCLCIFLGVVGGHKFYEGKVGMGILYMLTCGLFGIGITVDFFVLLFKKTRYLV